MEMTVKHAQHYVCRLCRKEMPQTLQREHTVSDSEPMKRTNYGAPGLRRTVPGDDQKGQLIKEIY